MRVWRYDPTVDDVAESAQPGDLDGRRAVFLASSSSDTAEAWVAVDDYDGDEAALLFAAPSGDEFQAYVAALVRAAVEEASRLGFASVLAHYRAGWATAEAVLLDCGFSERAPGMWSRSV